MTGPPPLPTFWKLDAPAAWRRIEFLSDLHLSEETPRGFEAFAAYMKASSADAVFILGDLFEAWVGDDARHGGFEARCAEVLRDATTRRTVGFMHGNRDFLVGADLLQSCGVLALADPTVAIAFGERLLLSHGDALCIADTDYQRFREQVRSPEWQRGFLARPLEERRAMARAMRAESQRHQASTAPVAPWVDVDPATATRWMHEAGTPTLIHGHTHRPGSDALAPGFTRFVLSDWDFDGERPRGDVLRWQPSGLARVVPAGTLLAG